MADTAQFFEQLTSLFRNLSAGKRLTLVVLIAGVAVGVVLLPTGAGPDVLRPIYSGGARGGAGAVAPTRTERAVPCGDGRNGRTSRAAAVPLHEARLQLAGGAARARRVP